MFCEHAGHEAQKDTFLDLQGPGTAQFTKSPSPYALDIEEGRSVAPQLLTLASVCPQLAQYTGAARPT